MQIGDILNVNSSTLALNKLELKQNGYSVYGADGIVGYIENFQHNEQYISIVKDGSGVGRLKLCDKETSILGTLAGLKSKDENKFILIWSYYLLNTIDFSSYVKGAGIPHIYFSDYKNVNVGVPSPEEQQKIADCLSSLDDLITAETQKLDALKEHKKGLMQQLFPGEGETMPKLRFEEFVGSGEWEVETLNNIAENLDFKRIPITENAREAGNVPYYGASGIIDYVKDFIFNEKLLCISEDGANLIARSYPIAFTISGKTWVNNHAHVLKFSNDFTHTIVENYLNSISLEDFLTGIAQPKLNRSQLDIIPIPLSKPNEQRKIALCLSSLNDAIRLQYEKIAQIQKHKIGLMQGLFPKIAETSKLEIAS